MENQDDRAESLDYVFERGSASAAPVPVQSGEVEAAGAFGARRSLVRTLHTRDIMRLFKWGGFPTNLRRFFIAQNGKCPYCARVLELTAYAPAKKGPPRPDRRIPTTEHVVPQSRGGKRWLGNKVVACYWCNVQKGDRRPHPCELLFAEITGDIVWSTLPKDQKISYLSDIIGRSAQAKEQARCLSQSERVPAIPAPQPE